MRRHTIASQRVRRGAAGLAGALVLGGLGFATLAGATEPPAVYNACVGKHGTVRMVQSENDCGKGETAISWNHTGPAGPQGPVGPAGPAGPQGEKGDTGATGLQGPQGEKGEKGDTGATGAQGPQGEVGPMGPQGPQGPAGPQGQKGDTGAQGIQGIQGEKGDKGDKGDTGATGAQGPAGPAGPQGPQGPIGPKGDKGDTGPQGPAGPSGTTGAVVKLAPGTANNTAIVTCPPSNPIAVGGGISLTSNGTYTTSAPAVGTALATDGQTPDGWIGKAEKQPFTVYVVCAK